MRPKEEHIFVVIMKHPDGTGTHKWFYTFDETRDWVNAFLIEPGYNEESVRVFRYGLEREFSINKIVSYALEPIEVKD